MRVVFGTGRPTGRRDVADTIIGIDLGTTNSAASYIDGDVPRLIPNALGEVLTPSVVGIDPDGHLVVGRSAAELMVTHPDRCASQFKRKMGSDWVVDLDGRTFTPEELSGLVLRALKQDAEAHLGRPITRAVITVPAYFNDPQRKATIHAGQVAGLTVERILNEPTAAALAYGLKDPGTERILLIFDLGGGTFDVSVVDVMDGAIEVRASAGEGFLGGEDFTRSMAVRVLERVGLAFERAEVQSPKQVSRLIQQCEVAKRALTRQDLATIRVPDRSGEIPADARVETITRDEFRRWTEHLMGRIEIPIRRALGDAGLGKADIQEVILVGGATRMPRVIERVADLFGRAPLCGINPDEVVALGAAVQAGLIAREVSLDDLVVTDVAPFSLGIGICKLFGHERRDGYFLPIIDRNTTIPVSRVQTVGTVSANQTALKVEIYQGEGRRVEDNLRIGEFEVAGIPRGPAGESVEVRFTYDLNGVLEVEATISATKRKFTHVVTRHARGLSADAIRKAVLAMEALKTRPREEAANRYLLRRAERLYGEIGANERSTLGVLLDGFEAALEIGDAPAIERHRETLRDYLDSIDPQSGDEGREGSNDDPW
jgi:molecular chaperone HscC